MFNAETVTRNRNIKILSRLSLATCFQSLASNQPDRPIMNAYLFAAVVTRSQLRPTEGRSGQQTMSFQTWDSGNSLIIFGDSADEAQKRFEQWLKSTPEGEDPPEVTIRKIAAAQIINQLFTESGAATLDWPAVVKPKDSQSETAADDDFEQGYWLDANQAIRPGNLKLSIGALQSDLPDEIRSGLNWSAEKQYYFLLSALSPAAPPTELIEDQENNERSPGSSDESLNRSAPMRIEELFAMYPEAMDKEAAALIRARNAAVAAWLWRRYAATTPLAANAIRIDPLCQVRAPGSTETII